MPPSADPEANAPVSRIASAGLDETLARIGDAELLAEGKVVLISLDAIAQRLGAKWAQRCEPVYEHVDRTLDRLVGGTGFYLRLSATDYLICQPDISRYSGQSVCLRALRDILRHFLGDGQLADAGLHSVVKIDGGVIETCQLDAAAITAACAREEAAERPWAGENLSEAWAPFVDGQGRTLRVSCAIEPVFELKGFARIGMRLRQRVWVSGDEILLSDREVRDLKSADLVRVDLATVARGLDRLRAGGGEARHPTLILPVSYTSLSSARGCAQVVSLFKEAVSHVRQGVICEISNIEGVPQSALAAALGLIRPYTLYTIGKLGCGAAGSITTLKGVGLNGLSFDLAPAANDGELINEARSSIDAARRATRAVMAYGASSPRQAAVVATLGATHVSIRS